MVRDNYINLCVFNFGKRCYVLMKNNNKVIYFESVNGKYVMPITSFSLYDNEGKSLTVVNQHFFISQLVNRINVDLGKGYFLNDNDIIDYLNNMKFYIENDINLKNLFKGSLMGEINEQNFESNKREILKYLDNYKIDTFVDYNNFSIFNGSLEKNDAGNNEIDNSNSFIDVSSLDFSDNQTEGESVDENIEFVDIADNDFNNTFSVNINFNGVKGIEGDENQYSDIQNIIDDSPEAIDSVNSTDLVSDNSVDEVVSFNNNFDDLVFEKTNDSLEVNKESISPINVTADHNDNAQSEYYDILSNIDDSGFENGSDNLSVSYIDEVKNRIQNGSENVSVQQFNSETAVINDTFKPSSDVSLDTVITDVNELPELDTVSNDSVVVNGDNKNSIGFVIFIIILILSLVVASYFIYNYLF